MAYEFIKTEVVDGVLVMTMHDPPTRNAPGPARSSIALPYNGEQEK